MRRRTNSCTCWSCVGGFSLIEAVVAIAIMAILAGATMPLLVKAVNQQREQVTRTALQNAWQGLFGSAIQQTANMRSDFGFDPTVALLDLGAMVTITAAPLPAGLPVYGPGAQVFSWGWNGPYWTGSVATNGVGQPVPADAWGHALQLVSPSAGKWQVQSNGQDGVAGTADDIYYPAVPMQISTALGGTATVTIQSNRNVDTPVTLVCWDRHQGVLRSSVTFNVTALAGIGVTQIIPNLMPGPVTILVTLTTVTDTGPPIIVYPALSFPQYAVIAPGGNSFLTCTLVK